MPRYHSSPVPPLPRPPPSFHPFTPTTSLFHLLFPPPPQLYPSPPYLLYSCSFCGCMINLQFLLPTFPTEESWFAHGEIYTVNQCNDITTFALKTTKGLDFIIYEYGCTRRRSTMSVRVGVFRVCGCCGCGYYYPPRKKRIS